ncbi:MAG: phage holin family protein [Chloroflexi bacterium]|nr:phage holin family protein [Chloroflexota bacterium]
MRIVVDLLVNALAIFTTAYVLPGVYLDGFVPAVVVVIVIGIFNAVLKPVLIVLTLPITVLTLGLFLLVINALSVVLASAVVPGFTVDGFWWALLFSLVLTVVNSVLHQIQPRF